MPKIEKKKIEKETMKTTYEILVKQILESWKISYLKKINSIYCEIYK